jgi:phosphatidylglycerol:prolipoprotein diacylglycerol transferase
MLGRSQEEILNYISTTRFHPTFFYEALWNLVGFGLVMWLGRKWYHRLRDGDVFLFYLIWYPLGRIIVEMFRPDAWLTGVPGLATAQLISLGLMAFAIVALIVRHYNWRPKTAAAPAAVEEAVDAPQEVSE